MHLLSHKLLRLFVLLLAMVFISETVYAGGMVAVAQVSPNNAESQTEHCHKVQQAIKHSQQTHEKQQSHANCQDCSHCFACFSMIVQAPLGTAALQKQVIVATVFVEIYHSPSTFQALKPPIA